MLVCIPEVLDAAQIVSLRERLDRSNSWVDGRVTAGYQGAPVKFNHQIDERSETAIACQRIVAGALECDDGSVTVGGRPVAGPAPDRGMLFQSPMLFPWLTTRKNVLFGPKAQRAAGTDWFGPFLTRLLRDERYPAVRYLEHRGLRTAYGEGGAGPFDYLAKPRDRDAQLEAL